MAANLELEHILEVIPPDTCERVKAAADKHSKVIHEALYHLTRLEIRDSESSFGKRGTLDVLLEDGHATSKIPGKINDLGGVQGQLASLKPAAQKLSEAIQHFQRRVTGVPKVMETFPALVPKPGLLEECLGYTRSITQQEVTGDLLPQVLAVHGGRLGTFHLDDTIQGGKVKLYWAVMGYFVHERKHITLNGLVEFVLAHELAHAFIHVGFDAVSRRWIGEGFKETDPKLREALAQYYAVKVVEELGDKLPDAKAAYEALLGEQKEPEYHLHVPWLDPESGYHPEIMRAALIPLRQTGPIKKFEDFAKRLEKEKKAFPVLKKEDPLPPTPPPDETDLFGGGLGDVEKPVTRPRRRGKL